MRTVFDTTVVPVAERRRLLEDLARPGRIRARQGAELAVRAVSAPLGPIHVGIADGTAHEFLSAGGGSGYSLFYMLGGRRTLTQNGRRADVRAGHFVIGDQSRPLAEAADGRFRVTAWTIRDEQLTVPAERMQRILTTPIPSDRGAAWVLAPLFDRVATLLDRGEPTRDLDRLAEGALVMVLALFESLVGQAAPDEPPRRRLGQQVAAYIEANLGDPDLSADRIAAAHHVSRRSLYRLFEERGTSVARAIRDVRLERARRQLADPELAHRSIREIGARCGMHDLTHFGRVFREAYGLSPREYRRSRTDPPPPDVAPIAE